MFNNKRVKGVWWVCAALAVLLAAGCVSAASEESGGSAPPVDGSGGAGAGSVPPASDSSPSPLPGGVATSGVEENVVVQVGEGNGGGEPLEPVGGGVSAEASVSEEGLERLRRVLGEDKFAAVLESAERQEDGPYGVDSGVLLGRLAGENGFLTEEGLGKLAERRTWGDLISAARRYSEEVLAEYANEDEERMAGPLDTNWYFDGRFVDEYSDGDVKVHAYYERADAENNRLWGDNDRSTPVGAFCWVVLRVRRVELLTTSGIGHGFRPWESNNLKVWHLEREAEKRGIELEWETPPVDADLTLRRVLLEATAPEIRSVVFAPGLPSVLRPAAEALYNVYDELLALPVRRVRPTVEELSAYRRLRDLTEEQIAQIWPEELALDYRHEDQEKYLNTMGVLRDDAVRELLNAECKERPWESACPPWEAPETATICGGGSMFEEVDEDVKEEIKDILLEELEDMAPLYSCPLFYKTDPREVGVTETGVHPECTVNEETAEVMERISEIMKRESGR